jgi:hypothetical protein
LKTVEGDEIKRRSPKFVTLRKKEFLNPGNVQGQTGFGQCLGHCCTDFNTGKNHGVTLRKFATKNVFSQKYDKIRSFDVIELSRVVKEGTVEVKKLLVSI